MGISEKEEPVSAAEIETQKHTINHQADLDHKAEIAQFKGDAIEAENAEFNMGVLEAVRSYPMATLWAFIMSCTIVSSTPWTLAFSPQADKIRSWSHTASS